MGTKRIKGIHTCTMEDLQWCLDGNLKTTFMMTQACLPYLEESKGQIINMSSFSGSRPVSVLSSHYSDVIMGAIASQIISRTIIYSIVHSDTDQRKHQSSASVAFVRGIHRGPVNSPHKWPVTRKMFPFDDVIMHWFVLETTALSHGIVQMRFYSPH